MMATKRIAMRKVREMLRLRFDLKLSFADISRSINVSKSAVGDCVGRFKASGLAWPLPDDIDDISLEKQLYQLDAGVSHPIKPLPVWPQVHVELRKKGVTKQLLWIEYKSSNPNGYEYSQFCNLYRQWQKGIDVPFRNEYLAGEKCFLDYAGQTIAIHDAKTGEVRHASIFIATLGASNYTFVEASWGQGLGDWLSSHARMFAFFGGVPAVLVPDNLKAAVQTPCRYDPLLNPSYYELAKHYDCAVIPARVRKPKDKAKVESAVLLVERWILAALRHRKFFSLDELNKAISDLLVRLNDRPFRKLEGNRRKAFENIDKPALKPLPSRPYELAELKIACANINYHVEFDHHYYSLPYQLVRKEVIIRATSETVEILHANKRVASHQRSYKRGAYSTQVEHMPAKHQGHVAWTPERMARWAGEAGPATKAVAEGIMDAKQHPQQGFNAVLGLVRLGERYGKDRLEKAAQRAIKLNSLNFHSVKSILKCGLDSVDQPASASAETNPIEHGNLRGASYYN